MKEIDASKTNRAVPFELWMKAPNPMVTLIKKLDITNLVKFSKKYHYKFNMMMCWCIGKAASNIKEFYLLPVDNKLMQYDKIAVDTVVLTKNGEIESCDIPFSNNLKQFNRDYLKLTKKVFHSCQTYNLGEDYMIIGTSALVEHDIEGAVNIYAGFYNNPFMIWGKYKKRFFRKFLTVSFQFHHTQMDGLHAARFLDLLQREVKYPCKYNSSVYKKIKMFHVKH